MSEEFEDTSVDTGSDISDSGECSDDSSMNTGDEAVEDSGSESLDDGCDSSIDDSGDSADDTSIDAGDEPIEDSGSEGSEGSTDSDDSADENNEAADDSSKDSPDGDVESADDPADQSPETSTNSDESAESSDEPADENTEATDDGSEDLPENDETAEGTYEPVDENAEATDAGADDLPQVDEPTENEDEPVDENAETADDSSEDLPNGNAESADYPTDQSSETPNDSEKTPTDSDESTGRVDDNTEATDDGSEDLPENDETAEGTYEPVDENAEATDAGADDLPQGDEPAENEDEPVDENAETDDDSSEDLPDGDAESADYPTDQSTETPNDSEKTPTDSDESTGRVDDNTEATDDCSEDLPESDETAEGTDEHVDENAEATDTGADDLPQGDEPTENEDEPVDENAETADDSSEDLPDGGVNGADDSTDKSSETPTDIDESAESADENVDVTDNKAKNLPDQKNIHDDTSNYVEKNKLNNTDQIITPDKADEIRNRIRRSQQQRANSPSGFKDFDQGKTNILTSEPTKLSSKNFDRLAEERGLSPEEASNLKYSMNEYQKPDSSLNDADHHPDKNLNEYATARHILKPEQAYSYNNGIPKDGYEHASSGIYQTPEMQTSMNKSEQKLAMENLALPKSNDARVRSDTTLNPVLNNGKQHVVIEGTAAPQNTECADKIFKANDGIDRRGGGKQIITDGGYDSGAVTEGEQHNIGDMNTDLNNPHLFENHPAGEYGYTNAHDGKSGFGQLDNSQKGVRDANAQRMAGGSDRRPDDDGGHYIANMFNGDSGSKNIDPQNRNLNRGEWKAMENNQCSLINEGNKVFTNNRSTKTNGSDRPDSYDAYTIIERPDGSREALSYHFKNESNKK